MPERPKASTPKASPPKATPNSERIKPMTADSEPPPPPPPGRPAPKPQLIQLNSGKSVTAARSKVASPVGGGYLGVPPGLGARVAELAEDLAASNSQSKKVTWHNSLLSSIY